MDQCRFMVLEPEVFDYIEGDDTFFEKEPLEIWHWTGNWLLTDMKDFGNAWILCEIRGC